MRLKFVVLGHVLLSTFYCDLETALSVTYGDSCLDETQINNLHIVIVCFDYFSEDIKINNLENDWSYIFFYSEKYIN